MAKVAGQHVGHPQTGIFELRKKICCNGATAIRLLQARNQTETRRAKLMPALIPN